MLTAFRAGNNPANVPAIINVSVACMAILISTVGFRKTVSVHDQGSSLCTQWKQISIFAGQQWQLLFGTCVKRNKKSSKKGPAGTGYLAGRIVLYGESFS